MKNNINNQNVINMIKKLSNGTETNITQLLGSDCLEKYNDEELTNICYEVFNKCNTERECK